MVRNWIRRLFFKSMRKTSGPWAVLEIEKFESDGRIKMSFDYNDDFVKKIESMGFQAETPEDTVQLFFMTSALRPVQLVGDDPVQPEAHPNLSDQQNVVIT